MNIEVLSSQGFFPRGGGRGGVGAVNYSIGLPGIPYSKL